MDPVVMVSPGLGLQPPSPVPKAQIIARRAFNSPKAIARAVDHADAADTYAELVPSPRDADAARAWAAKLRLLAVGASAGLQTGPAARALGGDGAQARQLRKALKAVRSVAQKKVVLPGLDLAKVTLGIHALLGSDPDEKSLEFDRRVALSLALSADEEGMAIRAKWSMRLERAVKELRAGASELRFFAFARAAGRILCPACSDAHHVTPDNVTRFLLNGGKDGAGLLCDEAFAAPLPKGKMEPADEVRRLRRCSTTFGVVPTIEDNAWWGANGLALAVLSTARTLADAPVPEGVLNAAVKKRTKALGKALKEAVIMPVAAMLGPPPQMVGGRRLGGHTAALLGLGFGGLTVRADPLEVFAISPEGFQAGLRTVIGFDERRNIVSYTGQYSSLGTSLTGRRRGQKPPGQRGERARPRIEAIRSEAQRLSETYQLDVAKAHAGKRIAEIVVDPEATAAQAIEFVELLSRAGYGHFRFLKTAAHGRTFPLLVRSITPAMVEAIKPGFQRPMVAVVYRDRVELFAPRGRTPTARRATRRKARLPRKVEAGYRNGNIVKFVIRPGKKNAAGGFPARVALKTQQALRYFERWYGAGPLLHVIAAPGALAGDVLRVARTYQERIGKGEIERPEQFWAGTACGDESYVANRKQPEGCPTGVAVAFSRYPVPHEGGLTRRFIEEKKKKKTSPPNPQATRADAPGTTGCLKENIHAVMNQRKRGFMRCYQDGLTRKPGLSGGVLLTFAVDMDGKPSVARVTQATLDDEGVHRCLLDELRRAAFKKPTHGACQVSWPVNFR